jgi:hypothetical protein
VTRIGGADGSFPAMAIRCTNPICTVTVVIEGRKKPEFGGGQCMELLGTPYVHQFDRCPVLARAVADESRFLQEPE